MPDRPVPTDLITRKEAAERVGIVLRTLDRRIASGELHTYRVVSRTPIRLSAAEVDELFAPHPVELPEPDSIAGQLGLIGEDEVDD